MRWFELRAVGRIPNVPHDILERLERRADEGRFPDDPVVPMHRVVRDPPKEPGYREETERTLTIAATQAHPIKTLRARLDAGALAYEIDIGGSVRVALFVLCALIAVPLAVVGSAMSRGVVQPFLLLSAASLGLWLYVASLESERSKLRQAIEKIVREEISAARTEERLRDEIRREMLSQKTRVASDGADGEQEEEAEVSAAARAPRGSG